MASTASTRFGDLLRRARQAAGLTQAELAERAGLSVRGINDLERGARQTPRKDTVALLAAALGLADAERAAFAAAARGGAGPIAAGPVQTDTLPTGTVTFLFTDIEGSTQLLQTLGTESYAVVLEEHRNLLREALTAQGGHEVDSQGDSSFMVFATAAAAVAGAVAAQQRLAAHPWPAEATVRVRMGLHAGTAQLAGDRYIGLDVHRAARIAAAGHGGQVLLSEATSALVAPTLPEGIALRELGPHLLKDLQRPERLFQLILPDLPADFPPLNALDRHAHNLPIQLTSFIGRERELAELKPLLLTAHLLTLTGPGGTGKTRLALWLAADALESFADGVWLVELAPLADPGLVPQTVAATLGLRDQPGRAVLEVLLDYLRSKSVLLVLDNCEHLIAACAQLAETLLRAVPGLRILASSREALGVAGETAYRVPSLALPEPEVPRLDALIGNDCVRLFVERAAAAHPAFHLTAANAPAITQISRRLDGIPLALELAAARTSVFPPDQIAARLDDRFRLLTGGSRTALPRHQTLLALIEWSHNLLTETERVLLRRLSVFAGGWSLEAAQAVCGEGLGEDVLDTLAHLADKSLLDVEAPIEAVEGRYHLLETIRQFARDRLLASGEVERTRDRHLEHFIQFAEETEPRLRRAEQLEWLERMDREHDNLRAALAWALERDMSAHALRLAGALTYYWELRGYWNEGLQALNAALALAERDGSADITTGDDAARRAALFRRAKALYGAARMHFGALFSTAESLAMGEESLRLWRELDDKWWIAVTLEHVTFMLGLSDMQAAVSRLEEGVALAREVEDRWPLAMCLVRLGGGVAMTDPAAARPIREEGVAVARQVGDKSVLSQGLEGLAPLYWLEGNLTAAEAVAAEALLAARAIGSVTQIFLSLLMLVGTACLQHALAKAKAYCDQAADYARETGAVQWNFLVLVGLGLVACFGGQPEQGVRVIVAGETLLRQRGIDFTKTPGRGGPGFGIFAQALERARARLGAAAFEMALAEGQHLTLEQALALAAEIEVVDAPPPEASQAPGAD